MYKRSVKRKLVMRNTTYLEHTDSICDIHVFAYMNKNIILITMKQKKMLLKMRATTWSITLMMIILTMISNSISTQS